MLSTKDYNMFILRKDNRGQIQQTHVKRIANSIKNNNLLHLRPILVNKKLEVIDGQHRLKAAQLLGVEIYYEIKEDLQPLDIINLNLAKSWECSDFLNYYCENGYAEYIKLKEFSEKTGLPVRIALNLTQGNTKKNYENYKMGRYEFLECGTPETLAYCWETIDFLRNINGHSSYYRTNKFWKALISFFSEPSFNIKIWRKKMSMMSDRFGIRTCTEDYYNLFRSVYNWRLSKNST